MTLATCPLCGRGMSAGLCHICGINALDLRAENILAHYDARLKAEAEHNGRKHGFID